LLICGIASALLFAGMNVALPLQWEGYSFVSQTVSELSAIDAPTRVAWIVPDIAYAFLLIAFGCGVRAAGRRNRRLRIAGTLLAAYGAMWLGWPFVSMHSRAVLEAGGRTLIDTVHVVFTVAIILLVLAAMGFAAAAFGRRFRRYSFLTMAISLVAGAQVAANVPLVGVWERIGIAALLLWMVALALRSAVQWRDRPAGLHPVPLAATAFAAARFGCLPPTSDIAR
jgi:hypothetical protein